MVGDARETLLEQEIMFDSILLDAPCSGLGTTRRKPEVKWKDSAKYCESIAAIQGDLLEVAANRLKPGGILVYSVCSPMPKEGAQVVAQFLQKNGQFHREDPRAILPNVPTSALDQDNNIQLRTFQHATDAFFMARLRKTNS